MMQPFKYLTESLAVAGQLLPQDMQRAVESGFRVVINNRPDHEEIGQPESDVIEQAALELGLEYHYLPIMPGQLSDTDISAFNRLMNETAGPALLFCRTGTRCTYLWALNEAARADIDWIVKQAEQAGYSLLSLMSRIEYRKQQHTEKSHN